MAVRTLRAFTDRELARAKVLLAAQVASMMGRKLEAAGREARSSAEVRNDENAAVPVAVSVEAHERLTKVLDGVNDEHRVQLLLRTLS